MTDEQLADWCREQAAESRQYGGLQRVRTLVAGEDRALHEQHVAYQFVRAERFEQIAAHLDAVRGERERERGELAMALLALGWAYPDPRIPASAVDVRDIVTRAPRPFVRPEVRALTTSEADAVINAWRSRLAPTDPARVRPAE